MDDQAKVPDSAARAGQPPDQARNLLRALDERAKEIRAASLRERRADEKTLIGKITSRMAT